jgi:hypothetical protein
MERFMVQRRIQLTATIALGVLALANSGCTITPERPTVLPQSDNSYLIISTAERENVAYKAAENEAKIICGKKDKKHIVLQNDSLYQGVDKGKKSEPGATDVAMAYLTGRNMKEDRSDDHKVTLHVTCA